MASRALCQWLNGVPMGKYGERSNIRKWLSAHFDERWFIESRIRRNIYGDDKQPKVSDVSGWIVLYADFQAIYLHNVFGFTITPEAIVGPITKLGSRWVVKNINLTVLYLKNSQTRLIIGIHYFHELFLPASLADLLNPMIDRNFDFHFCSF